MYIVSIVGLFLAAQDKQAVGIGSGSTIVFAVERIGGLRAVRTYVHIAVVVMLAGRANCSWLYTTRCWDLPHCSTIVRTYNLDSTAGQYYVYSTADHRWCTIICKTSCCHWNGLRTYIRICNRCTCTRGLHC